MVRTLDDAEQSDPSTEADQPAFVMTSLPGN
jgi:hypothetical protein